MHPYIELAKRTVEEFIKNRRLPAAPEEIPADMQQKAGVFVCLKKQGELCGCIGTFLPTTENIYEEIIRNAVSAATEDPRFCAVGARDLEHLEYTVDILSQPEKVSAPSELDPKKYGVIIMKDYRKGLLLPDLDGVNTVEEQLRIAKMKAGISPYDDEIEIYRFKVDRYK